MRKSNGSKNKKGGARYIPYINYDQGGPGGSVGTFVNDVVGIALHGVNTVGSTLDVIDTTLKLRSDMGVAFDENAAPTPNDIRMND